MGRLHIRKATRLTYDAVGNKIYRDRFEVVDCITETFGEDIVLWRGTNIVYPMIWNTSSDTVDL